MTSSQPPASAPDSGLESRLETGPGSTPESAPAIAPAAESAIASEIGTETTPETGSESNRQSEQQQHYSRSDFQFDLPSNLIAQHPLAQRCASRLMVVDGQNRSHRQFADLPVLLKSGDRLVFNNTEVIPARLFGRKETGGRVELMLERLLSDDRALVRIKSSNSPRETAVLHLHGTRNAEFAVRVVTRHDDLFEVESATGKVQQTAADCSDEVTLADFLRIHGEIPLPPYITRLPSDNDVARYQTVYASSPGAVAAPTAGLHFDQQIIDTLKAGGIDHSFVTLHVGAGTFQPMRVESLEQHIMHAEQLEVSASTVQEIEHTRRNGGRIVAVGTTSVRALESACRSGSLQAFTGETKLFLKPGDRFQIVDAMITNFHLPESTLLMLVAAFAGYEAMMDAYHEAIEKSYRFFSYGDAMLLWPSSPLSRGARE